MGKQNWLSLTNSVQPSARPGFVAPKPFVFPHGPFAKNEVQELKSLVKGRSVIAPVIVDPASDDRVISTRDVLYAHIAPKMQPPTSYDIPDRLGRLVAYRWIEAIEVITPATLSSSGLERVTQKVKRHSRITPCPEIVLTINDLRLLRMKLQHALRESLLDRVFYPSRLPFAYTMRDNIVRIALKRNCGMLSPHPLVERIMEKKIGEQGADHPTLRRPLVPILQRAIR